MMAPSVTYCAPNCSVDDVIRMNEDDVILNLTRVSSPESADLDRDLSVMRLMGTPKTIHLSSPTYVHPRGMHQVNGGGRGVACQYVKGAAPNHRCRTKLD